MVLSRPLRPTVRFCRWFASSRSIRGSTILKHDARNEPCVGQLDTRRVGESDVVTRIATLKTATRLGAYQAQDVVLLVFALVVVEKLGILRLVSIEV